MPIVEFKNASRIYKSGDHELRALDNVNMQLEMGKSAVIRDPSGAGKRTFLNMLGGFDSPTSGKIYVQGKDISTLSMKNWQNTESPRPAMSFSLTILCLP